MVIPTTPMPTILYPHVRLKVDEIFFMIAACERKAIIYVGYLSRSTTCDSPDAEELMGTRPISVSPGALQNLKLLQVFFSFFFIFLMSILVFIYISFVLGSRTIRFILQLIVWFKTSDIEIYVCVSFWIFSFISNICFIQQTIFSFLFGSENRITKSYSFPKIIYFCIHFTPGRMSFGRSSVIKGLKPNMVLLLVIGFYEVWVRCRSQGDLRASWTNMGDWSTLINAIVRCDRCVYHVYTHLEGWKSRDRGDKIRLLGGEGWREGWKVWGVSQEWKQRNRSRNGNRTGCG